MFPGGQRALPSFTHLLPWDGVGETGPLRCQCASWAAMDWRTCFHWLHATGHHANSDHSLLDDNGWRGGERYWRRWSWEAMEAGPDWRHCLHCLTQVCCCWLPLLGWHPVCHDVRKWHRVGLELRGHDLCDSTWRALPHNCFVADGQEGHKALSTSHSGSWVRNLYRFSGFSIREVGFVGRICLVIHCYSPTVLSLEQDSLRP